MLKEKRIYKIYNGDCILRHFSNKGSHKYPEI